MNCRACGAEMRKKDRFCANCGAERKRLPPPLMAFFALLLSCIFLAVAIYLNSSGIIRALSARDEIKSEAMKIVEYLETDDVSGARKLIFPETGSAGFSTEEEELCAHLIGQGYVSAALSLTEIELLSVNSLSGTVSYRVTARDLSSFLQDYEASGGRQAMDAYFIDYINEVRTPLSAELKVKYELSPLGVTLNYDSFRFADAVTGGLFSSFRKD